MSIPRNKKAKHTFRLFLCLMLMVWSSRTASAQYAFTQDLKQAYSQVLDLRIPLARQSLGTATEGSASEGYHLLVANYADVAELLVTDDPKRLEVLSPQEDIRLSRLAMLPKSIHRDFIEASILWQWALVKLKNGQEIRAAWGIRKAFNILEALEREHPKFMAHKPALGALKVMIGSVPDKYRWIMDTFGMRGTVQEGLALWSKAISSGSPFGQEADYYLQTFRAFSLQEGTQGKEMLALREKRPQSLLAHFISLTYLMKQHDDAAASSLLLVTPRGPEYTTLYYLDMVRGELELRAGKYAVARPYFQKYLREYPGPFYRHDANYRIGLSFHLEGRSSEARNWLQSVLQLPSPTIDADKAALKVAKQTVLPDRDLTKVRLLTDGGHYDKALEVLREIDPSKVSDHIELEYRKARLFDLTGNLEGAEKSYLAVLASGTGPHGYIRPNAALQLAYLYKSKGREAEARKYFQMVLSFEDYPYKAGLDNKAKAGLTGL